MSEEEEQMSGEEEEEIGDDEEESQADAPAPPAAAATDEKPADESVDAAADVGEADGDGGGEEAAEVESQVGGLSENAAGGAVERRGSRRVEADPETMTEAERALYAAKKRQEEELDTKWRETEEHRRAELQQIEGELHVLKQRQVERRKQREVDEREFAERRRADDEKRRSDEEARKVKMEADKLRRAEDKMKRQVQMAGSFAGFGGEAQGQNFVIQKAEKQQDMNKEKKVGTMSKEQKDEMKRNFMTVVNRPVDVSNLLPNDIKSKIKQAYEKIVKLEGDKYDLEKRNDRQEYDLRELFDREKQVARNKAIKAGVEPTEDDSNRPSKVTLVSKFDRQVDRRSYVDRRTLFESPFERLPPSIARGSGRPPPEWGRKDLEELETLRKVLEPPKYVEQVKAEGDAARPPVPVVPMQIPAEEFDPSLAAKEPKKTVRPTAPKPLPVSQTKDEHQDVEAPAAAEENGIEPSPPPMSEAENTVADETELEIIEEPVDH